MLIGIVTPGDPHAIELAGIGDVFDQARRQSDGRADYQLRVVAESPDPLQCASGLRILPDLALDEATEPFDTLIIGGTYGVPPAPSAKLTAWLRHTAPNCRRFGAVGTGAFLLGAAGLLDGKHVTTHWEYAAALAATYATAEVEPDGIFVRDGALFTAAGATAALDLSLALVEEDHGRALALAAARRLVMFLKRPGGQLQFSTRLTGQVAGKASVQRALDYIDANPHEELSAGDLAARVAMSERNFKRIFAEETGQTPAAFVAAARIDTARRLLEEGDLLLEAIATKTGFAGPGPLRRAFQRKLGVSPYDYRDRFQSSGSGKRSEITE